MLDLEKVRKDFPILERKLDNAPLVYFDNGATTQKPQMVIDSLVGYYSRYNANIHRGVHQLSQEATDHYEIAREKLRKHIGASKTHEVIFTSGTTHSINLVASGFASLLESGDEVVISTLEHHSNIVPWQMLRDRTGIILKVIPMEETGNLNLEVYKKLISPRTRLVSCGHISNALGVVNPIGEIIQWAHAVGAAVLIDGAQACPHLKVDVNALDVDFYVGSSHKMYGPTGVGFLYGKEEWLEKLPPYQGGGEMIATVTFEKTTYAQAPHKFEAGTPNIAGGIAFGSAIDYIHTLGIENIQLHEQELLNYATQKLEAIEGIRIYGQSTEKAPIVSFNLEGAHPYDVGSILDKMGIAIRTGHHCTQPIMDFYKIPGTVRASFGLYNTKEEIDKLEEGIQKAKRMLL